MAESQQPEIRCVSGFGCVWAYLLSLAAFFGVMP